MKKLIKHKAVQGSLIAAACAAAICGLALRGVLDTLEYKTLDHRFRSMPAWDPAQGSPANIALVVIDQTSLEMVSRTIHQRWKWPREFYAKMIVFLQRAGARAIIFDMYFSEPDMDRPEILGVDSDAALVAATAFSGNTIHSYVLQKSGEKALPDKVEAVKRASAFSVAGTDNALLLRRYTTGALPEPALTEASAAIGYATQEPESDNICRRVSLLARLDEATVMSQTLAAAVFLNGGTPMSLQPGRFLLGDATIAIDTSASAYLRWYRPSAGQISPFERHSAYNILRAATLQEAEMETGIPADTFKDRVVFIGSTAPGLFDNWATPLSKTTPGVEIQATALANLLRRECVTRVARSVTLSLIALVALATAAATSLGRRRTSVVILVPLLLLIAIIGSGYFALFRANLFIEIVPPVLAVFSTFLVSMLTNYLTERKHSRIVRGIFEHYLDHAVVENLIADPDKVRLGGERRECTVMFTDVADFTTTSETLTPEQVVHFMNIYLNAMTDIIIEEGGFVDKFIGDEIVAVFGAPNLLPDHAVRACRAVLRMREGVEKLQPQFREAGCQTAVFARTGMCTGEVIIGNMGSENRMNYTAMGNTMNLGARIQGINKIYGTRILVSQSTADAAGQEIFVFREVDAVRVKGKRQAVGMVELLGLRMDEQVYTEQITRYATALEAYRGRRWDDALVQLAPLEQKGDGPSTTLAARCREFQQTPPPDGWDGVSSMLTK